MTSAQADRSEVEVTVDGTALEPLVAADLVEVDVHEEIGRHGRCSLVVQNWDADDRVVRYGGGGPFVPGASLGVAMGYHSDLSAVFEGVIAATTAHFPARGRPVLRVEARSRSVLLEHPPRSRQLADVSDADVAAAVAADYSLEARADTGVTRPSVVSDRTSDWDFLKSRAERLGWALYVRSTDLVMRAPGTPQNPPTFEYTQDIVELHLTEDLTAAIDSAVGVAWSTTDLEVIETEQSPAATGLDHGGRADHAQAVGDAGWPLRSERDETDADGAGDAAEARALGRQRDAALRHVHGRGVVRGDPSLRCDAWLELTGVGDRLGGPHYLTAVRHHKSNNEGFRTEFQVGRPPVLTPPPTRTDRRTAGLAVGVVEAVEVTEGTVRVRVRLPWRTDGGEGVWARLATLDAGDNYGTVFVPSVRQEVLVGHLDSDPSAPVVLGQLFNGKAAPPVAVDEDNAVRALVSPGGHRVVLDDGDPAQVSVTSAGGHSVIVDDEDGAVVITHGGSGNTVTVSGDGVTLEARQGDVVLRAPKGAVKFDALNLEGKATGASKLESSATFDLTATGPMNVKGSVVKIN